MKKIVMSLLSLFLLTGCSVQYNVELNNDKVKEEINFLIDDISNNQDDYLYLKDFNPVADLDNNIQYKKKIVNSSNSTRGTYSYTYRGDSYRDSRVFSQCFDIYSIVDEEDKYYIGASGEFKCLSVDYHTVDKVIIKFKTDYEVIDNNADSVDGNEYTWTIDSNNYKDVSINIIANKKNNVKAEKNKISWIEICAVVGGLIAIALTAFFIIKSIGDAKNKF